MNPVLASVMEPPPVKLAPEQPPFALRPEEVESAWQTNLEEGLSAAEVLERRRIYGPNQLPPGKRDSAILRFLLQLHQPLVYILIAAGLITLVLKDWVDALVILGVVLVNAIIGFLQESKAIRALDSLSKTLTTEARVVRDGEQLEIPSEELVPGDLVLLQSGDRVPADLRLVHVRDLQADDAALTGESLPASKTVDPLPPSTGLADRSNQAFCSSLITYGTARGVVVATGKETEIGRISELMAATTDLTTPLTAKIEKFSRVLLIAILLLAAVTCAVGVWHGQTLVESFKAAVALAVGAIPEGLPAAVTILLAIGVSRMAKRRAIIRKLPAVETLGSVTVICSDKTGTLTQNQMTVRHIFAGGQHYHVTGDGFALEGEVRLENQPLDPTDLPPPLRETLLAGLLCNDARLELGGERITVAGDPTEGALIASAAKIGMQHDAMLEMYPRLDAIAFESQHQYMATLHRHGQRRLLFLKGAVERVLPLCQKQLSSERNKQDFDAERVLAEAHNYAARGMRVLAFAMREEPCLDSECEEPLVRETLSTGLVFVGLQAMIDPPRAEAAASIAKVQHAGIAVKMITGDHALTAATIADLLGIEGERDPAGKLRALTGHQVSEIADADLPAVANSCAVFARVSPEQKLRLVRALQASGNIVAMTGDGVNDAPALKQANIGVAMGITGTEVSKEAAHVVLTDDNFSTIESAVEEGRSVFDNLTKFIVWTLPTNLGEGLVILVATMLGITLPILPVQILWINMTTAVLLGLMLAFEPKEPGIMNRQPRDPKTPILTRILLGRIVLVGLLLLAGSFGLFEWSLSQGQSPEAARTVAVNVFVIASMFYLLNCRSLAHSIFGLGLFSNPWIWVGCLLTILLQLIYTYVPIMQTCFHSAPIRPIDWLAILIVSIVVHLVVEFEKMSIDLWYRWHPAAPRP